MDKQQYIDYLQETSNEVSPCIDALLRPYRETDENLYEALMYLVRQRLNKPLLKPALLRACYELCGGHEWVRIVPVCAAFELINISSYQANASFDNKLGVLTRTQKESQFIASMITREVASAALKAAEGAIAEDKCFELDRHISESNRCIYLAQHWDLNVLTLENYDSYSDEEQYLREYTRRCYLGSGIFSGLCACAGGTVAGASARELAALRLFGESYGTALHIINDIGDYVPHHGVDLSKGYQDEFSDLRNGRLTLPLYHLLKHARDEDASELRASMAEPEMRGRAIPIILPLLEQYGCIDYAQVVAKRHMKAAARALASFDHCKARDILLIMTSVARSNKYYWAWRNRPSLQTHNPGEDRNA